MELPLDDPLYLIPRCREGECYYEIARRKNKVNKYGRISSKTGVRIPDYERALKCFEDVLSRRTDGRDKDNVSMKAHSMYRSTYMYLQMTKFYQGVVNANRNGSSVERRLAQRYWEMLNKVQPKATQAERTLKKDYASEKDKDGKLYVNRSLR